MKTATTTVTGEFTAAQLDTLRDQFNAIVTIDVASPTYTRLIAALDGYPQNILLQLSNEQIKYVSRLAYNRLTPENKDLSTCYRKR